MIITKEIFFSVVVPDLKKKLGYKNNMQVPQIKKVVINIGMGAMAHEKDLVESVRDELALLSGQKPALARARKAISNFKIRIGVPVGYKVTLRGKRMYEFLAMLINFAMPRIRDFRGVSKSAFDEQGNYSLGIKEQTIFPTLNLDKAPKIHGLDVCIVTSAKSKDEGIVLLEAMGMPFTKKQVGD
ncbi:Ribosomal protein L5 [Candidatus Omnitrophus magneticus]|uniref:Large ribosomal subunit protein uL5 n=1 Tax=Candidatus Omnitrophus magneticus TaxID=1609969 RepID=A0A0F0CS53_9BACT|nr:Ribosomal protein L5 [Candidatus Omnitrophus magneticus]